jgi:hypothetical protein
LDLIAELLRASLLQSLGDDADRAARLRAAASALGERLTQGDRRIVPHAMLAAAEIGDGQWSVVDMANDLLATEWETLANAYPDRPAELLRAVLLSGIADAAARDNDVRIAAWYTTRSALDQGAGGRWRTTLSRLLSEWTEQVDDVIAQWWRPEPASSALKMPALKEPESFTMKLRPDIIARAEALQNQPNWPQLHSQVQASFVEDVTKLISLAEGAGFVGHQRAHEELKTALGTLGTRLREALELHERGLAAVRLRGDLVWWQQSRYSQSLKCGYDELDGAAEVAVAAAVDLHNLVPAVAPVAAEYVLADLVRSAAPSEGPLSPSDLERASKLEVLPSSPLQVTPASLVTALQSGLISSAAPALAVDRGLKPDRTAVLLFRDLQAAAAVAGQNDA